MDLIAYASFSQAFGLTRLLEVTGHGKDGSLMAT